LAGPLKRVWTRLTFASATRRQCEIGKPKANVEFFFMQEEEKYANNASMLYAISGNFFFDVGERVTYVKEQES